MNLFSRRSFLATLAGLSAPPWLSNYAILTAAERRKVKITDIKTLMLQGPRTYTLVKVETDAGLYGVAEAYGSPGIGVREAIHELRELFIGKDPIQIDRLYTGRYTDGSAHAQQRAMSGIEMALWDLAGKLLNIPTHALLGGKFRDRVRLYDHSRPRDFFDKTACRDWAQEVKQSPNGINMHKFSPLRNDPAVDPGRDPSNRLLSSDELRRIRQGYENVREALGFEHDILIGCHWEFDLRSAIELAQAVATVKPRFLEDPLPVAYSESWKRLAHLSPVPICTGENWMRRAEALPFIVNAAVDIIHPDLRNSGGFLENKRLADLADLYFLPVANHNTGRIMDNMDSIHWASFIRNYFACETVFFDGGRMDDVIVHDKSLCRGGFVDVPDRPGLGIQLNPDVVKSHLVRGGTLWQRAWWAPATLNDGSNLQDMVLAGAGSGNPRQGGRHGAFERIRPQYRHICNAVDLGLISGGRRGHFGVSTVRFPQRRLCHARRGLPHFPHSGHDCYTGWVGIGLRGGAPRRR